MPPNDEVQHVVNLTLIIAGFEGGTITLTDAIGNSVTTAAIGANQTLAQLTTAINAAITAMMLDELVVMQLQTLLQQLPRVAPILS